MVDWNDYRYFLAVQRSRTLAGAARELGVKHTTVARRLAALEEALGTRLFLQSPDGYTLTQSGKDVAELAGEIEKIATGIERRVAGDDARIEGTVRLTTSEAFNAFFMSHMTELRKKHPQLIVDIFTANRTYDLSRGEADLAVRAAPVEDPSLIARRLAVCGWSLYANEAYLGERGTPSSPEDLAGHDVIGFDDTLRHSPGGVWLTKHGEGANFVMRNNSIVSMMNAAILGMGIAVLPCFLGDQEPTLRRVTPTIIGTRDVWLVVHPDRARISRVRVVMEHVADVMRRNDVLWSGETKA